VRTLILALLTTALLPACGGSSGPPTGPPLPIGDTVRTITGTVSYFTTGPALASFDGAGRLLVRKGFVNSTLPRAANHIDVEIRGPDGQLLAEAVTNSTGRYTATINYGKGGVATQVTVTAVARVKLPFGTVARVLPGPNAVEPYSVTTPLSGEPDKEVNQIDIRVALAEGAAAYSMLQTIWQGFITAKTGIRTSMPHLDLVWAPGNGDRSFVEPFSNLARLTIAGGIANDPASNVDAWAPPKVMRLFGDYLLAYFFHTVAPEGEVSAAELVPSAAWREGFLDFWACVARGTSIYWDSEGIGAEGRVVRYFDVESYFDPGLGSLGPDDPNVYQDPALVGIGSAFTVAEILWDIHDRDIPLFNDQDGIDDFPLFLTLQFMRVPRPGFSYPYFYTLLDLYEADGSLAGVRIDNLLQRPENQGMRYPATPLNGLKWPTKISPDSLPNGPILPPLDKTIIDKIDSQTPPGPINVELGLHTQRYYFLDILKKSNITITVVSPGDLEVDILTLNNAVMASGVGSATALGLGAGGYIVRIRSVTNPQIAEFDMRVKIDLVGP